MAYQEGECEGLGLLKVTTTMDAQKTLREVTAQHSKTGLKLKKDMKFTLATQTAQTASARLLLSGKKETGGLTGLVQKMVMFRAVICGLFCEDDFRRAFLTRLGAPVSSLSFEKTVDDVLDQLADHIEQQLDVDAILACAR